MASNDSSPVRLTNEPTRTSSGSSGLLRVCTTKVVTVTEASRTAAIAEYKIALRRGGEACASSPVDDDTGSTAATRRYPRLGMVSMKRGWRASSPSARRSSAIVLVRVPSEMMRPSQTESMMAFFDTTSGAFDVMKTSRSIAFGSRCRVSCPDISSLSARSHFPVAEPKWSDRLRRRCCLGLHCGPIVVSPRRSLRRERNNHAADARDRPTGMPSPTHHPSPEKEADPGVGPGSTISSYRPGTKIASLVSLSTTEA